MNNMLLFMLFLILFLISGSILLTRLLIIHKHNVADEKLRHAKEEEYLKYRAECEKNHESYMLRYTWFDSQCLKFWDDYYDSPDIILLSILTVILFIAILVASIIGICTNTKRTKRNLKIYLDSQIAQLNANRSILLANEDKQLNLVEITEYNNTVTEFKNNIATNKLDRENLWLNWYTNPVYDEFTGDEVSYITQADFGEY